MLKKWTLPGFFLHRWPLKPYSGGCVRFARMFPTAGPLGLWATRRRPGSGCAAKGKEGHGLLSLAASGMTENFRVDPVAASD